MRRVLVTTNAIGGQNLGRLAKLAEVIEGWKLSESAIRTALPSVDVALILGWPSYFSRGSLSSMKRLKVIQTLSVGVNQVRFEDLPQGVRVCSNAGAYSTSVGEHAWGLLLAAAKEIGSTNSAIKERVGTIEDYRAEASDTLVLKGKTLGILGFGGIGKAVARFGISFGMRVVAFGRSGKASGGVKLYRGRSGMERVLKQSDAVLIALPLTKSTEHTIGASELLMMKSNAVLVNVARGDIVDRDALLARLKANRSFRYATDVWWYKDGKETLDEDKSLVALPNFVGTPHSSGPAGVASGEPQRAAVDNVVRYLKGLGPRNVVDASEYVRD